jgi:hypothetical protein
VATQKPAANTGMKARPIHRCTLGLHCRLRMQPVPEALVGTATPEHGRRRLRQDPEIPQE